MKTIKIGDTVKKKLTAMVDNSGTGQGVQPSYGTVVWIHPERRFYVAEFPMGNSVIRECFWEGLQ